MSRYNVTLETEAFDMCRVSTQAKLMHDRGKLPALAMRSSS
jgi:hypothetical protein